MLKIGCHLSASKGYLHMGKEAISLGGNSFQFFTRNPRGGSAKAIDEKDTSAFNAFALSATCFTPLLVIGSITLLQI